MEGLIGGGLIGVTVALLGNMAIKRGTKVLLPMGEEVLKASISALGTAVEGATHLAAGVGGLFVSNSESCAPSPTESAGMIEKVEEFGKDIVVDLVEEEAATFIKMLLVAAL